MKKIFAVLLASMMAATALVGCGGSGDSSTASKTESMVTVLLQQATTLVTKTTLHLKYGLLIMQFLLLKKSARHSRLFIRTRRLILQQLLRLRKMLLQTFLMMPQLLPMYSVSQVTSSTSFRQQALLHRLLMLKIFLREIQQSQFQLQHSTVRFTLIRKQVITVTTSYMISQQFLTSRQADLRMSSKLVRPEVRSSS